MGKIWWRTRKRTGIRSGRIVETTATTTTWTWSLTIKAMIPPTWRAGAVVVSTFTANWRRGLLHYRNSIRCWNTPEVGRARWLWSPASIASVTVSRIVSLTTATSPTTTTTQLLWTVIVEIPFSVTAVSAIPVVRVRHLGLSLFSRFSSALNTHSDVSVKCLRVRILV